MSKRRWDFTREEQHYLAGAQVERQDLQSILSTSERVRGSLETYVKIWEDFVFDLERHQPTGGIDDCHLRMQARQEIEVVFRHKAPTGLQAKIDAVLVPIDRRYRAVTVLVDEPWGGRDWAGRVSRKKGKWRRAAWWWYWCPAHLAYIVHDHGIAEADKFIGPRPLPPDPLWGPW